VLAAIQILDLKWSNPKVAKAAITRVVLRTEDISVLDQALLAIVSYYIFFDKDRVVLRRLAELAGDDSLNNNTRLKAYLSLCMISGEINILRYCRPDGEPAPDDFDSDLIRKYQTPPRRRWWAWWR
jgi:hypothetical protein